MGTAISMMLIGQIIKSSYYYSYNNCYAYAIYYLFVSHAVFYPRAPLLFDRAISLGMLLIFVVYSITPKSIQDEKINETALCIPALYNTGGMERVLTEKVNFLVNIQGYDITIVTTDHKEEQPFASLWTKR